ncbi:D-alanyl-D-alanine carboxypeptidase [Candidatus Shapirobacteria bacterium]|nr:D-alanyl-D-alanine carboxypeptidase [Candidatus Shapirobacteria bacterium]
MLKTIAKVLKKGGRDLEKFLRILPQRKLLALSFAVLILLLFFLPGQGYYQNLFLFWRPPSAKKIAVDLPVHPYPVNKTGKLVPWLSAKSVVVTDLDSAALLYAKNENLKLLPASTTKIMTAIIALENFPLDKILVVPNLEKNGQVIGLLPGEKMAVKELLIGLLVASGNDAAEVLAGNFPGGRGEFIKAMNKKAAELNLANTHFENPSGLDNPNHFSSALDLARLTGYALNNPTFAEIVATREITIQDAEKKNAYRLSNINKLVGQNLGVLGVKTGWTAEAGECLVAFTGRDSRRIITVVLGATDRFGETKKLLDWVFANFSWEKVSPYTGNQPR